VKILLDMNLSPEWGKVFADGGHESRHWSEIGQATATDAEIMKWARSAGYIVFTHDLDFGALLASTGASAPSTIQIRGEDTRPSSMGETLLETLRSCEGDLLAGALITIDPRRRRITSLPLRKGGF